ncbi:MAG: hypothetical protein L0Y44_10830 [Phycisphaerales bacterium]|nr:hypothetical protein [Phycisphaerales bacterium]
MELSSEQSLAANRLLAEYSQKYQQDIVPKIQPFQETIAKVFAPDTSASSATMLEGLKRCFGARRQIFDSIASLDSEFFDALLPMLTDRQKEKLVQVRARRERERLRGESMLQMRRTPVVDLIELEFDLAAARKPQRPQGIEVETILNGYEARLLSLERKLQRGTDLLYVEMFEKLIAWGETSPIVDDETEEGQNSRALAGEIWLEITVRPRKAVRDIRELNRTTCNQLAALEASGVAGAVQFARELRHEWVIRTFGDSRLIEILELAEGWDELLERASEELQPEQLQACKSVVQSHQGKLDKCIDELIAKLVEIERVELPSSSESGKDKSFSDQTALARETMAQTRASLESLLGQAATAQLLHKRKSFVKRSQETSVGG